MGIKEMLERKPPAQMIAEMLTQTPYALALEKLWQFRRHPDWKRAERRVRHKFFTIKFKGKMCCRDEDVITYLETADQEFIDEIIRNGG
jgi:hypothetical protein